MWHPASDRSIDARGFIPLLFVFIVKPFPESHVRFKPGDKRYRVNITADRHCARCKAEAKRDGYMGMRHGDGRSSDRKMRLMPDGSEPPQSGWACTICKRYFCYDCFRMEDAWDHDNKCLRALPCDDVVTG